MSEKQQQLRWAHIRNVEALQALELENTELRRRLSGSENSKRTSLKLVSAGLGKWFGEMRGALEDTKNEFRSEAYGMMAEVSRLKEANLKYQELQLCTEDKVGQLEREKAALQAQVDNLEGQCRNLERQVFDTQLGIGKIVIDEDMVNKYVSEIKQLKEMNTEMEERHHTTASELIAERERADALTNERNAQSSLHAEQLNVLRNEIRHLQNQLVDDRINAERNMTDAVERHEHETCRLRDEIAQCQMKLDDQDDYIQKLVKMVTGNKTNFAKFVELKTENASLVNQLKKVVGGGGQGGTVGFAGLKPTAPTNADRGRQRNKNPRMGAMQKDPSPIAITRYSSERRNQHQQQNTSARRMVDNMEGEINMEVPALRRSLSGEVQIPIPAAAPGDSARSHISHDLSAPNSARSHLLGREASEEELKILAGYTAFAGPPPTVAPPSHNTPMNIPPLSTLSTAPTLPLRKGVGLGQPLGQGWSGRRNR